MIGYSEMNWYNSMSNVTELSESNQVRLVPMHPGKDSSVDWLGNLMTFFVLCFCSPFPY